MKIRSLISLLAFVVLMSACSTSTINPESYVEVVCKAEKEVDPDTFFLGINLSESAKGNITAMETKMLAELKKIGVESSDLSVTSVSGDNWNWWRKTKNVTQYKSYRFKTGDVGLLNKVCDELDKLGYSSYYLEKVDYSGIDSLKHEVQQAAVNQARVKANNLLAGDGRKAGKLIYLQENRNEGYGLMYEKNIALDHVQAYEAAPAVSFQKIKVYYEVVARYSID